MKYIQKQAFSNILCKSLIFCKNVNYFFGSETPQTNSHIWLTEKRLVHVNTRTVGSLYKQLVRTLLQKIRVKIRQKIYFTIKHSSEITEKERP